MTGETGLSALNLADQYRTGESDPVAAFYRPCLLNSCEYGRAVGYFRSSVYLVIGPATVEFARRGGMIRLICSPDLDGFDADTISEGYEARRARLEKALSDEIDGLLAGDDTAYRLRVLSTLVAFGALDIRLALRPSAKGIYHEKIGIFKDLFGSTVSFLGSANETWNGWHFAGNHEAMEVFRSWKGQGEADRVARHEAYFERLWNGLVPGVEVVPFPEAARRRLVSSALASTQEVEFQRIGERVNQPRRRTPLPHQTAALEAWRAASRRGILEHATGSGKTFTAITAIKEHLDTGGAVLVLVPSRLLLEQWEAELREEIPDAALIVAGGGHSKWRQPGRLKAMTVSGSFDLKRIVLTTMQTAATDDFRRSVRGGSHLMIVADEVHQSGSSHHSKIYEINAGVRLGLSATPRRYGDPDGTAKLFGYFGPVVPPPFTLNDAIRSKRLVEYEYHPHPIHLTADEAEEWKRLTLLIVREMGRKLTDGPMQLSEKAKMLLIRRSRIAKKANAKIALASDVLSGGYEKGQRWLVYCEDGEHLRLTMEALRERGLSPFEYHTGMNGDRSAALDWFRSFGGILVSIKCLDEGVDIPAVDHALILASSQNPRQFIQRRGRVLRTAHGKTLAVIHDALVVPLSLEEEPEQLALLKSELARAIEFADSAVNKTAGAEIRAVAASLGFDPETLKDKGIEEETEE
ncbi:superfamily II DNA or RNA helicase [Cupriavidus alkaliphilus]|uniref:DEAD/DEAH box helicase family protein n=1 Tax=Cupriavidus alkaliphilus TaxID=942866 RepID=UPI000DE77162|nr:DEAD/DEAH box helicase family protein [Cupriavidus alkaliphilus]PVY76116.1 superfamily II DNA or RNA helicase [Cupriavidus alkaliphilus]